MGWLFDHIRGVWDVGSMGGECGRDFGGLSAGR